MLQGVVTSLRSLAAIITPLTMPPLFSQFASESAVVYLPGAPYLAAGGLTALGLWLAARSDWTTRIPASPGKQEHEPAQ